MSDFEERSRRAANAIRREAARHAHTDSALAEILSQRDDLAPVDSRDTGWSRPRIYATVAIAVGVAAGLVGLAVIVVNDRDAIIEPPATQPVVTTTPAPATTVAPTTAATTGVPTTAATTVVPSTIPTTATTAATTTTTAPEDWIPTQPSPADRLLEDDVPHVGLGWVGGDFYQESLRLEDEWAPRHRGRYVQVFSNGNGSRSMYVQTVVPRPEVLVEPIPGSIGPWELFDGSGEHDGLTLAHGDIAVMLDSNWLNLDQLRAIAEQLGPRADGRAGWDVGPLAGGLEQIAEDYWWTGDERTFLVLNEEDPTTLLARIDITAGVSGVGTFPLAEFDQRASAIIDFDGSRARYERLDGGATLTWEYSDGVLATLSVSDTIVAGAPTGQVTQDDMIAIARRSPRELSRQEWEETPVLPPGDDCQAFNC